MSRRKQVAPKRRADAAGTDSDVYDDGLRVVDGINQQQTPAQVKPRAFWPQHDRFKRVNQDFQLHASSADDISAFAEFIVVTRRQGKAQRGPFTARTAHDFHITIVRDSENLYAQHTEGIMITWNTFDDSDFDHKVLCPLPFGISYSMQGFLQQQHLQLFCQELQPSAVLQLQQQQQQQQQWVKSLQGDGRCKETQPPQQQQQHQQQVTAPVMYNTYEVHSDILQEFTTDVIGLPDTKAIKDAMKKCEMAAAAAANSSIGSSQQQQQQPANVLLLPARHMSLMAAAAVEEVMQQQQGSAAVEPSGGSSSTTTRDITSTDIGRSNMTNNDTDNDDLLLWRLCIGVSQQQLLQDRYWSASWPEQHPNDSRQLTSLLHWLVPHWVPNKSLYNSSSSSSNAFDAADLYSAVKPSGTEPLLLSTPDQLLPTLRPYQRRAVAWMLGREGVAQQQQQQKQPDDDMKVVEVVKEEPAAAATAAAPGAGLTHLVQQQLHPLWRCGLLLDLQPPPAAASAGATASTSSSSSSGSGGAPTAAAGGGGSSDGVHQVLYFNPVTGSVGLEPPAIPQSSGGILADEMGLGKTVELLALISTNRFQKPEQPPAQQAAAAKPSVAAAAAAASVNHRPDPAVPRCCRCGEAFETGYYTKDGWVGRRLSGSSSSNARYGLDSDSPYDSPYVSDNDNDESFIPGKKQVHWTKRASKRPAAAAAGSPGKRSRTQQQQQQQQQHGTGHQGAKRRRIGSSRLAAASQQQQWTTDECIDNQQQQQCKEGIPVTAAAATAAVGSSSSGLMCSACLRDMALQEVHEPCGTTLIVVPSSILVQWVDELMKHIKPGALTLKVYVGQFQPGAAAVAAGSSRKRPAAGSDVRPTAAAAAGGGAAAAATAAGQVVTAAELAAADVVVTTYDVLRREFELQPGSESNERSLRRKKRYAVVPTPLSRLKFWRLVLDEAQQVQGSTAKAAEMTKLLQATHRWAVTGTPISRGVEDLLGTLRCLKAEPWASDNWWWKTAIADPVAKGQPDGWTTLLRVMCPRLGGVLWRTAKADVLLEMGLPPQAHHTTVLRLSAIERHWYTRSHQECAAKAQKVLQDAITKHILESNRQSSRSDAAAAAAKAAAASAAAAAIAAGGDGRELDAASAAVLGPLLDRQLLPTEQKKLLLPLLRLRQACLHPQVGAAGLRAALNAGGSSSSSAPLTMDQILTVLTAKARTEAEESQRQLIGALNGLAALMRLNGDTADAVAAYRKALATAEGNKQEVRTDPLQMLHSLHNLYDLLQYLAAKYSSGLRNPAIGSSSGGSSTTGAPYGPGVARTLRDDSLASEAAAIRNSYLTLRRTDLEAAAGAYLKVLKEALPGHRHKGLGLRCNTAKKSNAKSLAKQQEQHKSGANGGAAGSSSTWQRAMMGEGDKEDLSWMEIDSDRDGDPDHDESDDHDDNAELTPAAAGSDGGWYVNVIDALEDMGKGDEVAGVIREKLQEADTYRQKVAQNATAIANRFDTLYGLKLLISQELSAMHSHQLGALQQLEDLHCCTTAAAGPDKQFIEQAGQCGRCRAEMGVTGLVCRHCRLDEQMRKWEVRLFSLHTRALVAGTQVDADAAAQQAQLAAMRRVGRGGLNEAAGELDTAAAAAAGSSTGRRQDTAVSETQVVRHPSEVERVLRLLQQQISRQGLTGFLPGVSDAAAAHLNCMEASRRLFTAVGGLSIAQRQLLYAHDELAMALLRIETRMEGEQVTVHEALFRLTEAEQVIKNSELSLERALAEGELNRALGKLRYLKTIAAARKRAAAAAAATTAAAAGGDQGVDKAAPEQSQQQSAVAADTGKVPPQAAAAAAAMQRAAATAAGSSEAGQLAAEPNTQQQQQPQPSMAAAAASNDDDVITQDNCPICHDSIATAAAVLPCGHVLCCCCADALSARIPAAVPHPQKRISCPTCRSRIHVSEVAYVDSGRSNTHTYVKTESTLPAAAADGLGSPGLRRRRSSTGGSSSSSSMWQGEQQLIVSGSYGTKIEALLRRLLFIMQQDQNAKIIVFSSWQDGLDIVGHALKANGVVHACGKGRKGFLRAIEQFKNAKVNEEEALGTSAAAAAAAADPEGEEPVSDRDDITPAAAAAGCSSPGSKGTAIKKGKASSSSGGSSSSSPRVLLLLVSQGAAGLNLTEAQHVILLEPLLDPAQELQAMGRVNRFGQTRTTHVHRFVIEHTIEENVAALCHKRAAAMDMSASVPAKRGSSSGGSSGGGSDAADLTVRDVAALLSTKWSAAVMGDDHHDGDHDQILVDGGSVEDDQVS